MYAVQSLNFLFGDIDNCVLPLFGQECEGDLIKYGRKLHRHLELGLIMVDLYLTYICVCCADLNFLFCGIDNQTPALQVEIGFYLPETF